MTSMPPSCTPGPGPVDALAMRGVMGRFATGVAVVTTGVDGAPHGMTVNSLTSVSLEPPLLLVCLTTGARTTDAVVEARRFAVNVLSTRQEQLALRFARRGEDHFEGLGVTQGLHEIPVVPDALVHLECTVVRVMTAGDHEVVLGEVGRICQREGKPLGFLGGRFSDVVDRGHEVVPWFF
ncbi:flavin reductase family protein [Amycolatopsis rhabdoformis]|uniref:Flavin reductase family protein n=1 Tax=Amycolatopsis rhabdoformis TaxID=1448059 RepID=A0ABZ1I0K4_9PSEU|nr:flavin reductase family protein [Amycolatopsis rhabdoformis]WSE27160.1 flavin reductase family protein [Amycolatopsis rhabdoformis]